MNLIIFNPLLSLFPNLPWQVIKWLLKSLFLFCTIFKRFFISFHFSLLFRCPRSYPIKICSNCKPNEKSQKCSRHHFLQMKFLHNPGAPINLISIPYYVNEGNTYCAGGYDELPLYSCVIRCGHYFYYN